MRILLCKLWYVWVWKNKRQHFSRKKSYWLYCKNSKEKWVWFR